MVVRMTNLNFQTKFAQSLTSYVFVKLFMLIIARVPLCIHICMNYLHMYILDLMLPLLASSLSFEAVKSIDM